MVEGPDNSPDGTPPVIFRAPNSSPGLLERITGFLSPETDKAIIKRMLGINLETLPIIPVEEQLVPNSMAVPSNPEKLIGELVENRKLGDYYPGYPHGENLFSWTHEKVNEWRAKFANAENKEGIQNELLKEMIKDAKERDFTSEPIEWDNPDFQQRLENWGKISKEYMLKFYELHSKLRSGDPTSETKLKNLSRAWGLTPEQFDDWIKKDMPEDNDLLGPDSRIPLHPNFIDGLYRRRAKNLTFVYNGEQEVTGQRLHPDILDMLEAGVPFAVMKSGEKTQVNPFFYWTLGDNPAHDMLVGGPIADGKTVKFAAVLISSGPLADSGNVKADATPGGMVEQVVQAATWVLDKLTAPREFLEETGLSLANLKARIFKVGEYQAVVEHRMGAVSFPATDTHVAFLPQHAMNKLKPEGRHDDAKEARVSIIDAKQLEQMAYPSHADLLRLHIKDLQQRFPQIVVGKDGTIGRRPT